MKKLFKYQGYHLLAFIVLGALLYGAVMHLPEGRWRMWGSTAGDWVLISWLLAAIHQAWIWFFWRLELYHGAVSAWLGKAGFWIYLAGYVGFGAVRMVLVIPIAQATPLTLSMPRPLSVTLIVVTTPLILWAGYAAIFYFGLIRASGADHFNLAYRGRGLETRGIYKYIRNPMYAVLLLLIYHPGLFYHSRLGLITAAAHHAFVWCAYFFSEKPDLEEIYGSVKQ